MSDTSFDKFLIVIAGPTAVGKTSISIKLAKKFQTEIVSCDSRQFYRELEIGTAKPSAEELAEVQHHFINSLSIKDTYDVRKFEEEALELLEGLFKANTIVIMTGGSGLFVDAITKGFDPIPQVDPSIRAQLIQEFDTKGLQLLQEEVAKVDPNFYEKADVQNPQRLMRALEVFRGTGQPFSSFRVKKKVKRPFGIIQIGLEMDREELYDRINLRMEQMIEAGLFGEAEKLYSKRSLNALQTVGYSEIFGCLQGEYDREEAIRLLKRNSRRYAKRQLTWFKKNESMTWFQPSEIDRIMKHIETQLID